MRAFVDASWRRVATYLHLQDLVAGRDVVEVWSEAPDPRGWQTLAQRGARRITVISPHKASGGQGVQRAIGDMKKTGLAAASAQVVLALDVAGPDVAAVAAEARRVLTADGVLVLGVLSRDPAGGTHGASYYDVIDACDAFPHVRVLGVAPFAGTTLVEYGVQDPEPLLDGTLVERGEHVEHYVAIAGPPRRADFGYGVVQVPVDAVCVERAAVERAAVQPVEPPTDPRIGELRLTIERHAAEMRARELELAERDAYIRELELASGALHELEGRVVRAEQERNEAEVRERETRRSLAEAEGRAKAIAAPVTAAPSVPSAEVEALRRKLADAEAESWKQMRARSEAEAEAAKLREENHRKLSDARKLATVELTRATEEAIKKSVSLADELDRSESRRKAALAELAALKQAGGGVELAQARTALEAMTRAMHALETRTLGELEAARAVAEGATQRADRLRDTVQDLELQLAAAQRERGETRRDSRVEHDAERDRALQEQAEELVRLRAELSRREGAVERAAAAAAHERARAERFVADERQAVAERNDARARAAEAQARVAGLQADKERAQAGLEQALQRAEKAESDLAEKKERIRELKRELEQEQRRALHGIKSHKALSAVRARVHALETAIIGEATRLASLEAALRA